MSLQIEILSLLVPFVEFFNPVIIEALFGKESLFLIILEKIHII